MLNKKKIQKLAFIDPDGKNKNNIRKIIFKVIDILLNKVSNAEKFSPLPINFKKMEDFNLNDLPISERQILKKIKFVINHSMNASNPYYLGHMDSLPTTMSVIGDVISSTINNCHAL